MVCNISISDPFPVRLHLLTCSRSDLNSLLVDYFIAYILSLLDDENIIDI